MRIRVPGDTYLARIAELEAKLAEAERERYSEHRRADLAEDRAVVAECDRGFVAGALRAAESRERALATENGALREALDALENAMIMARLPTDDRDADILNAAADVVAEYRRLRAALAAGEDPEDKCTGCGGPLPCEGCGEE